MGVILRGTERPDESGRTGEYGFGRVHMILREVREVSRVGRDSTEIVVKQVEEDAHVSGMVSCEY